MSLIFLGETVDKIRFMLPNAFDQIARYTDI